MKRRQVGDSETYHGQKLRALFMGPDLLSEVDGQELPNFYLNVEAALGAGRRYVDAQRKAFDEKMAKL